MTEAKHGIFRDCLGFRDFKNFDGVRFSFKGVRVVTFKLKDQMEIDTLIGKQFFDFKRTFKRNGKLESSIIKCKIRGLRSDAFKEHLARKEAMRNDQGEDGSVPIKITGCEYKITEERLKEALSYWGKVTTEIKEELFTDPHDSEGTNRTGIYSLRMIIDSEIPELLPIDGLRIKLQYQGVKKLCTGCYGKHLRRDCKDQKISWKDYIEYFIESNPQIPKDFYGASLEKMSRKNMKMIRPEPKDFGLPKSEDEFNQMMSKMMECGFTKSRANEIMNERKEKFLKSKKEYEDQVTTNQSWN